MSVSITTISPTRRLTRKENVKSELEITVATFDSLLEELIDRASAAIERYCNWRWGFGRQAFTVTVPGYGDIILSVGVSPIITVSAILYRSTDTITDYSIEDRDEGTLYREDGWYWTAQSRLGLTGRQRFPSYQTPMPGREEPDYSVTCIAGYILPPQNLLAVATVSVDSTDSSFNDSASGFPALLKAGDILETSGFAAAANNGSFLVTGTPTTAKIAVSGTLTTVAAGASVTLKFKARPDVRSFDDVEKAAIETVKTWHAQRKTDSMIAEKQAGPMRIRYEDRIGDAAVLALPPVAVGLLRPWRRAA